MRPDPVGQRLAPGRLGVGEARGAEHGDEDLGLAHHAGVGVDDRHLLARVVDEQLVARHMMLAHHRREAALELAEQIAEARVAVALGMNLPVLLPEHHQIDAWPLGLACQRAPVRFDPPAHAGPHARPREQALLEDGVGDVSTERPGQACGFGALEVVLDGTARGTEHSPDRPRAHALMGKPQHLS